MLLQIIKRELRRLTSRKIYIFMMLIVPICFTFFFLNLMGEGLPLKIPVGVVDLDHTSLSRKVCRSLNGIVETLGIGRDVNKFTCIERTAYLTG